MPRQKSARTSQRQRLPSPASCPRLRPAKSPWPIWAICDCVHPCHAARICLLMLPGVKLRRNILRSLIALLFACAYLPLTATPGHSGGSTCQVAGNFLKGYISNAGSSYRGAKAEIDGQDPDLCGADSTSASTSTAWAMIQTSAANNVNISMYAQVGYGDFGNNGPAFGTFYQYTYKCKATSSCSGSNTGEGFNANDPGPSYSYRVYRGGTNNYIKMEAGQAGVQGASQYDPIGDWNSSWKTTFAGETWHTDSDVPGTVGNRVLFDGLRYWNSSSTSWEPILKANLGGTGGISVSRYHRSEVTATSGTQHYHFTLWTDPL